LVNEQQRESLFIYQEIQMLLTYLDHRTPEYEEESAVQEFDRDYNGCFKTFDKD
jgi:hypothetical protein